jgi:alpha-beta hydrolase superfamily lysophospholipase
MAAGTSYHQPAAGLRVRGTVIIVPGRGETPATYGRFGARLAYDAYQVAVTGQPDADPASVTSYMRALSRRLTETIEGAAEESGAGLARPLVLVGSDLSAAGIAALVRQDDSSALWWPQGVVLAGLPGHGLRSGAEPGAGGGWEEELDIRTHCPVHRGTLGGDTGVRRGSLARAVPEELLDAAYHSTAGVPHLLLAGALDPLSDHDALARAAKSLPSARLAIVRGAHHDVLNDLQHRSVAAEVVTFLEALRDDLTAAVAVQASAW